MYSEVQERRAMGLRLHTLLLRSPVSVCLKLHPSADPAVFMEAPRLAQAAFDLPLSWTPLALSRS